MSHGNVMNIWCSPQIFFTLKIFPVSEIAASAIHVNWVKHLHPSHLISYKRDYTQKIGMRLAITIMVFVTHCTVL